MSISPCSPNICVSASLRFLSSISCLDSVYPSVYAAPTAYHLARVLDSQPPLTVLQSRQVIEAGGYDKEL
jgi:hypothetical protein